MVIAQRDAQARSRVGAGGRPGQAGLARLVGAVQVVPVKRAVARPVELRQPARQQVEVSAGGEAPARRDGGQGRRRRGAGRARGADGEVLVLDDAGLALARLQVLAVLRRGRVRVLGVAVNEEVDELVDVLQREVVSRGENHWRDHHLLHAARHLGEAGEARGGRGAAAALALAQVLVDTRADEHLHAVGGGLVGGLPLLVQHAEDDVRQVAELHVVECGARLVRKDGGHRIP
mmetsp:Transcript_16243/g.41412  ORF Transcript_16243/g.41412 Transcript_16243/m.41412 type:complete len:233 (-) Transcript_16243:236-934(-)